MGADVKKKYGILILFVIVSCSFTVDIGTCDDVGKIPPTAVLGVYPDHIAPGGSVTFDASQSTPGSGGDLVYRWEINKYITTLEQKSPFFVDRITWGGTYDIGLHVSNNAGTSYCHSTLYVSSEYHPPEAKIEFQGAWEDNWAPTIRFAGIEKEITFDASSYPIFRLIMEITEFKERS